MHNPWQSATKKPATFPILFINRERNLQIMDDPPYTWSTMVEYDEVVQWQAIELPRDVFGSAIRDGVTLT